MYVNYVYAKKIAEIFKGVKCLECGNSNIDEFLIFWSGYNQLAICKKCSNVAKKITQDYIEFLITEYNLKKEELLNSIGNYYDTVIKRNN